MSTLGPDATDDKVQKVLNRIVTYDDKLEQLEWEPDPRHAEIIVQECGMTDARTQATPSPERSEPEIGDDIAVDAEQATGVRGLIARTGYLSQDRFELKPTHKDLAQDMKAPSPRVSRFGPSVIEAREAHCPKAPMPISRTESGRVMDVRFGHSQKAESPMDTRVSGSTRSSRSLC